MYKGKSILVYLLVMASMLSYSQNPIVNKFRDSTWFKSGVRFDSTIYITKGAGNGKVLTSNGTGYGTWQTFSSSGVTQQALDDSLKRLDSTINAIPSPLLTLTDDTLTISGGNSVILPVYIQIDSSTINSYDVLNSQNTPPISPNTGDVYLVGNVPTGAWVGHAKDIAEWDGADWVFTDGVQGDFLYNATNALTYIFRSGNWVQTTGIPALNNGNIISSGLRIGTNNARSLTFETNNVNRGRFDSIGRFHVYNLPTATDTFITTINSDGLFTKTGKTSIVDTNILSTKANVTGLLLTKQDNLVSGTNIKTINSNSLLGSGNIVTPDAQTLTAGTNTLTISGGNTVDLNRKVDSSYLSLNSTRDSLVFNNVINGINYRTAFRDSTGGGGGGSLSSLTAASSINNIFNTNYKQRWNWNTLAGDTSLVLESNSTAAASNLNTVFGIVRRGANATSTQTVTGQVISVKNTGTSSTNIGLNLDVSGATNNYGLIVANGNVGIGTNTPTVPLDILGNLTNNYPNNIGIHATNSNAGGRTDVFLINNTGTTSGFATLSVFGSSFVVGALQNNTQLGAGNSLYLQSDANTSSGGTKTINFITGGYSNSPTLTITAGNPGNVGIGTTTPVASAKLQISSTTSGFLPPVMTSTQASAISSPAQGLMLFVTDTNGTFTSVGWWGYNGATWEKLNN